MTTKKRSPGERRVINRANQAKGQALEDQVEAMGAVYAARGLAWITRLRAGRLAGGKFVARTAGDFMGLTAGGRAILIECKSQSGQPKIAIHGHAIKAALAMLKPHQLEALQAVAKMGGCALIIYQCGGIVYCFRMHEKHLGDDMFTSKCLRITPNGPDWLTMVS